MLKKLFSFPNPVNEYAARIVASVVVLLGLTFLITRWGVLLVLLAYGFIARVLTGPKLSPLGMFATKSAPKIFGLKETPGPPKRFAQFIGTLFSLTAVVLYFGFSYVNVALIVIGLLTFAAFLEASLNFCLGCKVFSVLMKFRIIPQEVCQECSLLSLSQQRQTS